MTLPSTILRCLVGSEAYGTKVDDALSGGDRDEMGVYIQSLHDIMTKGDLPITYRTAAEREKDHNAKSQPGDLDLKLYDLRHFCKLALGGNPDVLLLLFTSPLSCDARGMKLQSLRNSFVSKVAVPKFKGYMSNQRLRMLGLKGQKDVHRPELVKAYSYDTKYAMQMIRLGYMGLELISTGRISVPMAAGTAAVCRDIRLGKLSEYKVLKHSEELELMMQAAAEKSPLPEKPDHQTVWDWASGVYLEKWKVDAFDHTIQKLVNAREQKAGDDVL